MVLVPPFRRVLRCNAVAGTSIIVPPWVIGLEKLSVTKAVVARAFELLPAFWVVPIVPVGSVGVPVNVGLARLALRSSAVCCAVETGLFASLVLFTLLRLDAAIVPVSVVLPLLATMSFPLPILR